MGETIFFRVDGIPVIDDYMIKGFFKDSCAALNRADKEWRSGKEKLAAYKSKIDGCIHVYPQYIPLILPKGATVGDCQRPLRVNDASGQRVCLAKSESVPAGTTFEFDLVVMSSELKPWVKLWLDYGQYRGIGQWRNSGKGRFTYKIRPS